MNIANTSRHNIYFVVLKIIKTCVFFLGFSEKSVFLNLCSKSQNLENPRHLFCSASCFTFLPAFLGAICFKNRFLVNF